jgi:hypothetical protein
MLRPLNGGQIGERIRSNPFVVGPHPFGRGLFVVRNIEPGETVLRFRGQLIDFQRSGNPRFERYCVQVGPDTYTLTWAPERFINHSCDPNLGFRTERTLAAIRPITEGEELTFDYSTSMAEDSWTMECHCGTLRCRTTIGDFVDLPADLKAQYRLLEIVPDWLSPEFEQCQLQRRSKPPRSI